MDECRDCQTVGTTSGRLLPGPLSSSSPRTTVSRRCTPPRCARPAPRLPYPASSVTHPASSANTRQEPGVSPEANVSTASRPSSLRITDLRVARLRGAPFHSTLIRIDTDQGISGYGEVRDGGSPTYALMLKSRLLGQNPCDVDRLFRRVKQCGPPRPPGRRRVRRGDGPHGPGGAGMDIGLGVLRGRSDCVIAPPGMLESSTVMHPFTGIRITPAAVASAERVGHAQLRGLRRDRPASLRSVPFLGAEFQSDPWPPARRPSGAVDAQRTALDELVAASPMGRHGAARHRTSPAPRQRLPPPADASASATSRVRHQSARDDGMTG